MQVITAHEHLLNIAYPSKCLRCLSDSASEHVQIIETNTWIRHLHNPFSILSLFLFLLSGALVALLAKGLDLNIVWAWLFVYMLILSVLRNFTEKTSRVVELPYCPVCLKKWERNINIEYVFAFVFVIGSSLALYIGVHRAYPAAIPTAWTFSLLIFLMGKRLLKPYDPPLDLRKSSNDTLIFNFGNIEFAKQTISMNTSLAGGFECKDCGAFISVPEGRCPKCKDQDEDPNDSL
ncbi:MAG: hypothetical protein ACE5GK_07360 [Nitrospiria bacterium]